MYHTEGLTIRNKKLLEHALSVLQAYGSPWILAGDYNMAPSQLAVAFSNAWDSANAFLFPTEEPTHCPAQGVHRVFDYFLCSSTVHDLINRVFVERGIAASPIARCEYA